MTYIEGEMTFTPGTSSEEIRIHMRIEEIKTLRGMTESHDEEWKRKNAFTIKLNENFYKHEMRTLKAKLKSLKEQNHGTNFLFPFRMMGWLS